MVALDLKRACKAAGLAWTLGVCLFVAGYLMPTSNPDLVANTVLFCAVPLASCVGARFYYQHAVANGAVLGVFMFAAAGSLDAIITVPLLIMPSGGSYSSFYGDPGFWVIGLEYVASVTLYSFCTKPSYAGDARAAAGARGLV
mmetsp:Transcript_13841/g.28073  ORF Transcript_13841/g.28073 Transcript_13841/m.28073 type:complete len:143 (-) Transcript_13841:103-531(-)